MYDSDTENEAVDVDVADADADAAADDMDDPDLHEEVAGAMGADQEYDVMLAAEMDPSLLEEADEDGVDAGDDAAADILAEAQSCELLGNRDLCPDIGANAADRVQFRTLGRAEDSRMPDIPTVFELAGLIISRATCLEQNAPPLVPAHGAYDPYTIARDELLAGKAIRAVLRGDTEWKWSDFAYFPLGFMNSDAEIDALHAVR